ncbi:hypothetical protein [Campylobacter cuniculorum]|uniref:dTDP-4-dehydrorhamnose 3,5-epimerase n=2 Tax=Campylobacter cuniculorum TaxID=374106 RepID=A0A1W6BX57_9BACT|nr:hypothetical protein [Campylobacter cuniculorum]ARJ56658.1 dTDP-4-dehydrorhamnose 3,5-epimerase [Campylobacter cuniculorum DSM 23162 = LMG 24588]QOR04133.1 hypothetical protein A0071_08205 [Campylobacter cuniculorum]
MQDLEIFNKNLELNNQLIYNLLMSNIIINSDINSKDKQLLLLLLQSRDRNFIRINPNEQVFENIRNYLTLLKPLKLDTDKLIRVGGANDGGYVMYKWGGGLENSPKALSLGVSEYSPWDLEMAEFGFEVIEYDASIEKSPYIHKNIHFYKKFIGAKNDEHTITITQALMDNAFDTTQANILQCDIENSEWQMLEDIDIKLLSAYFTQVIFEFHGCNVEEIEGFKRRKKVLERLNEYFVPIHTHLNNHGKIFYSRGLFWSTTIEVSYLRKDLAEKFLQNGFRKEGNLKDFDTPTYLANVEIPLKFDLED